VLLVEYIFLTCCFDIFSYFIYIVFVVSFIHYIISVFFFFSLQAEAHQELDQMHSTYAQKYQQQQEDEPESTSPINGGGSSILLSNSNSAPVIQMTSSIMESSEETSDAIRKSVKFIKERLKALKQIALLDESTMLEGGWTPEDVREELLKLQSELSNEKMRVTLIAGDARRDGGGSTSTFSSPNRSSSYQPFSSTASSTMSASREHLFSDEVAKKLERLTKKLNRTWKQHEKEESTKKLGKWKDRLSKSNNGPLSHLIPQSLQPAEVLLRPLFRGDRSPDGLRRQRRRARASVTLRK
jgi:hypothetical protein